MKYLFIIIIFVSTISATNISIVSNTINWKQSTVIHINNNVPWEGVTSTPALNTYTTDLIAGGGTHVSGISGATNIASSYGVRYYRTTFNLGIISSISADLRVSVDNDVHIFINGHVVALEGSLSGENFYNNPHHLLIANEDITNGYAGGDAFDSTAGTFANSNWAAGTNEIILAVRNLSNDSGGFVFRMDIVADDILVPEPMNLLLLVAGIFILCQYKSNI